MNATHVKPSAANAASSSLSTEAYETSRFGTVNVLTDSIVEFPDGLIGLGGSRYALLSTDPTSPFLWLQSLEDPGLALPVVNPHKFFTDYEVELADAEAQAIGLDDGRAADVYVTVTAAHDLADFTVNLKAPILMRDGAGHQLLNQASGVEIRALLFPAAAA